MRLHKLSNFNYDLPERLIALHPVSPRSSSKLLIYSNGKIVDSKFGLLCKHLKSTDRLIFNDTLVLNAKLFGRRKRRNGLELNLVNIEFLLIEKKTEDKWVVLCKPLKKIKLFDEIVFSNTLFARVISKELDQCVLCFSKKGAELDREISDLGHLPLPPYIIKKRVYQDSDELNYQSIFARQPGAVASPTASLHFDEAVIKKLKNVGVRSSLVTLHVGAGTFLPVKSENIDQHKMHFERGFLSKQTAEEINQTKSEGGRIIPVGTTALRLIETAARSNGSIKEFDGKTDIFIKPGYKFKIADGLITNFHFPRSTLLMLISAFVGDDERKKIYEYAVRKKYRFLSYGDSSLLIPKSKYDY